MTKHIVLGGDHAGFGMKEVLRAFIEGLGYTVADVGTFGPEPVDYPDFAHAVGIALAEGRAERGILLCGSGVGASIAANKIPGVRAAICHDHYSAVQGVEHDDMNVLVLGARVIGIETAKDLAKAFLEARFMSTEDRFVRRLNKILEIERKYRS